MSSLVHPPPMRERPRTRRRAVIWVSLALALLLLAGATWLLGGFDGKATPYLGPEVAPGENIETRFWDIEVIDAYVVAGEAQIRTRMNVTNKTDHHVMKLTPGMVLVRIEDTGEVLVTNWCDFHNRSTFNPLISTGAICEFDYEYNEIKQPPTEDFRARVIVLDQEMAEDLLTSPEPAAGEVVAHVVVDVVHVEEEP